MIAMPARYRDETFVTFHGDMDAGAFLDKWSPSRLVLSKGFCPSVLTLAREAKRRSVRTIGVLADDRSSRPELFAIDREICELATEIVVQTKPMSDFVIRTFGRHPTIIEEPVEVSIQAPRDPEPDTPLRVLWYGREGNHDTLEPGLGPLARDSHHPMAFTLVTNSLGPAIIGFARDVARQPNKSITISEWSMTTQRDALGQADIVVIPSLNRPDKHVKGHNRLVEAIASGVFALAHPIPLIANSRTSVGATRILSAVSNGSSPTRPRRDKDWSAARPMSESASRSTASRPCGMTFSRDARAIPICPVGSAGARARRPWRPRNQHRRGA